MVRRTPPWVISAVLAIAYLIVDPPSADLAAQEYRASVFDAHGLVLWDNAWYGGHHMPGYSILFPPLAGWLGPRLVGALSAVAAAWLFDRVAEEHFGDEARLGAHWFAAATAVNLLTGRLTFALGCALGLAAVLAVTHRRDWLGALLAALATLASPVAGMFLGIGAAAWFVIGPRRKDAVLFGVASVAPVLVTTLLFPEGGVEPFVASAFWPAFATLALIFVALPREERVLRLGVVLYALVSFGCYVLDTPIGGNVTRLGAVFAGPVLACLLWPRHARTLALVALPLLYWQWNAPVRDYTRAKDDPAVHASYYDGVVGFLKDRSAAGPVRVEVPFTRNHWEARWLAPHVALARGWERQLDVERNDVFYDGRFTAARFTRWLSTNAVSYVAVPDAELDHSAAAERFLVLTDAVPALKEVYKDAHWRVFAVSAPFAQPLASGGTLTRMGTDDFTVRLPATGGEAMVRIHWTRWWDVVAGDATVRRAPGDWTFVKGRGEVTVRARLHT